ncbi:hypothetical protein AB6A40_010773 [Gnathostoma spinigerum]|uniref:G-protein coupled receptors family 1 profile domain-containing protein n=1 Tax=Gnathostoma spinigerum TaxID=75299 RepID=A0ABD6F280_9BILA
MVIAFIGCWLPLTAVNLVKDFQKEPKFLQQQPYLWPLIAHVIAMSTVIWNPLLFFWLTRRSKHPILRRIRASSDAFSHFLSRLTSFRRQSTFASRISQSSIGYRTSRRACIRAGDTIASQGHPLLARLSTPGHRIDKVIMIRKMTH